MLNMRPRSCILKISLNHKKNIVINFFWSYSSLTLQSNSKGVPCGMRGKGKRYAYKKPQGFQTGLIVLVLDIGEQCFPFIAVKLLYQPYGFGKQLDTARYTCLLTVEPQPQACLIITDKMGVVQFHQVAIGCTCITGKEKNFPCRFHFLLQSIKAENF